MMTSPHRTVRWAGPVCAVALIAGLAGAQSSSAPCAGQPMCTSVTEFTATITDFRTSVSGRYRLVSAVMRFQNRTAHPLILGYVSRSGVVTDDRGNRYTIGSNNAVRGIGAISGSQVDTKFVLQPGESSDARFEFSWVPEAQQIIGTAFEMDLAIREIVPVTASQFQLGKEHPLHFDRLGPTTVAAGPAAAPASVAAAGPGTVSATAAGAVAPMAPAAAAPAPAPPANACGSTPHCYSAGPFIAQVTQFTSGAPTPQYHAVRLNVQFQNVSAQPIILAYKLGSGVIIDNYGNRYSVARGYHDNRDNSASGIGVVDGRHADPQFVLQPGQSRSATFKLTRFYPGKSPIGTGFNYDVVIEQLGILPSQQIQSLRDYSLSFTDLAASGPAAALNPAKAAGSLLDALRKKIGKP